MSEEGDPWTRIALESVSNMSPEDQTWVLEEKNWKPFTSHEIITSLKSSQREYDKHLIQRFFSKITPMISHISIFANAMGSFGNASPLGVGVIWGSLHLLFIAAMEYRNYLDIISTFMSDIGHRLALFSKWRELFPEKSFAGVSEAMKLAYKVVIEFYVVSLRHLRRNPAVNFLRTTFLPGNNSSLRSCRDRLNRCTEWVKEEVNTAHMQKIHCELSQIPSLIDPSPTPCHTEIPTIRIIPHANNRRWFFGREDIIDRMRLCLCRPGINGEQDRFILCGPGGIGKTQIALEYTYRHIDEYKAVIWILADSKEKIRQAFSDAAYLLGIPRGSQSDNQTRSFVLNRLSTTNEKYLLCFDNADDLGLLKDCLPRTNNGSIIVTSRDSSNAEGISIQYVTVPEFTVAEGSGFLEKYLAEKFTTTPVNSRILQEISQFFHGYPLALAQVGGFLRSGGCELSEILPLIRNRNNSRQLAAISVSDYPESVLAAFELSFDSLPSDSKHILDILVYLDPDKVPFKLFQRGCVSRCTPEEDNPDLAFMGNMVAFYVARKGLKGQSLIKENEDLNSLSIHRFIQEEAFHHLCQVPQRRRRAFENTLFLLRNTQPRFPNIVQHWSPELFDDSDLCLPHIYRLADRFFESPDTFAGLEKQLGELLFECATYQFERFYHNSAAKAFKVARRVLNINSSPNVLTLSDCYRMEGRMFNESGQAAKGRDSNILAMKFANKAIKQGNIDCNDQRLPRILTGLGNSLSQLGHYADALDAQIQAITLCQQIPDQESSDATIIVNLNLGFLMFRRGELDAAEQILRKTLDLNPNTTPPPPVLYALGNTLLAQEKVDEAFIIHHKGLEIYIKMFGEEHALVARCAYKVGEILLLWKGEPKIARVYLRKAIKIYLMQESEYYTVKAYARALRMLAKSFEIEKQMESARRFYSEAFALRERIDGRRGSLEDPDSDYSLVMFYWDQ